MFDAFEEELLDLAVTERGHAAPGHALAGVPACIILCIRLCCSSSRPSELV